MRKKPGSKSRKDRIAGIDLGDRKREVCVLGVRDEILERVKLANTRGALVALSRRRRGALVVMEVPARSERCSRHAIDERKDATTFIAVGEDGSGDGLIVAAPYDDHAGQYSMWVTPSARRRGVGALLVNPVIEWSSSRGFNNLLLDVGDRNVAAIALYSRMGFQPTGKTGTLPEPRQHILEHQRALPLNNGGEHHGPMTSL